MKRPKCRNTLRSAFIGAVVAGTLHAPTAVAQTVGTSAAQTAGSSVAQADIQRGRYLIHISGCNDCHTPGYPESNGTTPEKLWLTGSPLGWRGPWGTTYASNLRLVVQNLTETQWLRHARSEWRPPMPWFNLRAMSDADLLAIYRYVRHLGAEGKPAPAYVPPDRVAQQPYVQFPKPPK